MVPWSPYPKHIMAQKLSIFTLTSIFVANTIITKIVKTTKFNEICPRGGGWGVGCPSYYPRSQEHYLVSSEISLSGLGEVCMCPAQAPTWWHQHPTLIFPGPTQRIPPPKAPPSHSASTTLQSLLSIYDHLPSNSCLWKSTSNSMLGNEPQNWALCLALWKSPLD